MDKSFKKKIIPRKLPRSAQDRSRDNSQGPRDRARQTQDDAGATSEVSSGTRPSALLGLQPASAGSISSVLPLDCDDLVRNAGSQTADINIVVTPPSEEEYHRSKRSLVPLFFDNKGRSQSPNSAGKTAKNVLKGTLGVLSSALEGVPLPAVKGVIDTLRKLIIVFEATKANSETLDDLNTRCKCLLDIVINPLKAKARDEISPEFREIICRLEGRLLKLISEIDQPQPGITLRMINAEDTNVALKAVNDKITQHIEFFMLETHVLGLISQDNILKAVRNHALHPIIQNLTRANASYDSYLDTPQTRSVCFQNTRQQLLGEITEWITSTDSTRPPIYVLGGIAGIGKSTVAQTMATRCAQLGYLGASFFFSRAEKDCKTARLFFSNLAFDLANYSPEFAQGICTSLEQTPGATEKTLLQQFRYLLLDPLKGLSLKQPIVIVIDALDECEDSQAAEILSLLSSNLQHLPGFKFFITTRPEPHINVVLKQHKSHEHFYLHEIEASVVEGDIRSYLEYELSTTRVQKALPGAEWDLNEYDFNSLVEHAGRLFIIASTAIRFILDTKRYDPQSQMAKMLIALENKRNLDAAQVMDVMYMNILKSGILEGSDEDVIGLFQQVVGAIIVLENPLPLHALAVFLGIGQSKVVAALSPIHSIIAPSGYDQTPQVYHKSFADFITNLGRCKDIRLHIPVELHHAKAARYCFNILNSKLHQNMLRLEGIQRFKYNKDIGVNGLLEIHLTPELQYACIYWGTHLSNSGEVNKGELIGLLKEFCFMHLMHWLEVLSWLEQVDGAYYTILKAQEYMAGIGEDRLTTILIDISHCITKYHKIITRAAGHIYISVVPFLPQETIIYMTYAEREKEIRKITVLKGWERHWNPLLAVLDGHSSLVTSMVFSADGSRLAFGLDDTTVMLWDGLTGASIATLEGHSDSVESVVFSPNGSRLASGSNDHKVKLWNGMTGASIATLEGHSERVNAVVFSPDGSRLASASDDCTLILWNVLKGMSIATLEGHSDQVTSVVFSPDGSRLASGSHDNTVILWNGLTGVFIVTLGGHSDWVTSVVFSPDGSRLVCGSDDHRAVLWNALTGAQIATLGGNSGWATSLVFSPDGSRLASGSHNNAVVLWSGWTGMSIAALEGHSDRITYIVFSPDGSRLASGSHDNTVMLWNGWTGASIATLEGHSDVVRSVVFSPDGSRMASASDDNNVRLWNGVTGLPITTLKGHSNRVTSVVFSPDGCRLASGSDDKTAMLWNGLVDASIATIDALEEHSDVVRLVKFSPDGSRLASISDDNTIKLWNGLTGILVAILEEYFDGTTPVVFSSDGTTLATGSSDSTVMLWNGLTGAPIATLEGHSDQVTSIVFSPDGSRLASGSYDCIVILWDGLMGKPIATLEGHSKWVTSVVFSPDGSRLASGSCDHTVKLWNGLTGASIATLEGHSERVNTVVFSHDGTRLASGSDDGVMLWDGWTSAPIATLEGQFDGVLSVVFSPDGSRLASVSYDNNVRLWNGLTGASIALLQGFHHITPVVFFINSFTSTPDTKFDLAQVQALLDVHYSDISSQLTLSDLIHNNNDILYNSIKIPILCIPPHFSNFHYLCHTWHPHCLWLFQWKDHHS